MRSLLKDASTYVLTFLAGVAFSFGLIAGAVHGLRSESAQTCPKSLRDAHELLTVTKESLDRCVAQMQSGERVPDWGETLGGEIRNGDE